VPALPAAGRTRRPYNAEVRILIVSDIHANLEALDAVLDAAERFDPVDAVWCLGDTVGYGPEPNACIERLRARGALSVLGNHDAGAIGRVGLDDFNVYAAEACRWTAAQLTDDSRALLEGLSLTERRESFTLVHGTPNDPLWDYMLSYPQANDAWYMTETTALAVGHSHLAFVCEEGNGVLRPGPDGLRVPVGAHRLLVNPGSVGQPRDGDPRAAYAVYDDNAAVVTLARASYDIAVTQRRMVEVGLPEPLVGRLSLGR